MVVKPSTFLQNAHPVLKKLVSSLSEKYSYVSILGSDVSGTSYSVRTNSTTITDSTWNERGFVLRIFNGIQFYEYSFNQLNNENLEKLLTKIKSAMESLQQNINKMNINMNQYSILDEQPLIENWQGSVQKTSDNFTPDEIIQNLTGIKNKIHQVSPKVINAGASFQVVNVSKIFISPQRDLSQTYTWSEGFIFSYVKDMEKVRYASRVFSGLKGFELVDEMDCQVSDVVEEAITLLAADKIQPGEYDVICSPDVVGLIAHEAFGHSVEMDMFVKNRAKAQEYIGKPVATPLVEMHDGAKSVSHVSSYWFDDEGTLASDTVVIEKGILKTGISDVLASMFLRKEPTGNGKRESFERKAYTRMTNTFFSPGSDRLEDMIHSIEYGYLLEQPQSGMEDPKNWGIQCIVSYGREIVNGKLTGKIVAPIYLTGYVPDLLSSITMVSTDFHMEGTGACGKGHKEWVKVSAGGPYIKAKARLS